MWESTPATCHAQSCAGNGANPVLPEFARLGHIFRRGGRLSITGYPDRTRPPARSRRSS
jgi:hypothetical protein